MTTPQQGRTPAKVRASAPVAWDQDLDRCVSFRTAAKITGTSVGMWRAWRAQGKITVIKLGTKTVRIKVREIKKLIDDGQVSAVPAERSPRSRKDRGTKT